MDRQIATLFGLGRLRPGPGTWGSAAAVVVGVGLHRLGHFPLLAVATLLVTLAGFRSVRRLTAGQAVKDRPEIVIDEVSGQWIALLFPSLGFFVMGLPRDLFPWPGWVAAFLFFRLFDIWKPWFVGRADRRTEADAVMWDDMLAGLLAGVATMIAAGIAHGIIMR